MKRRRSHVGCLFWIALILLAVVIFVFNRSRFETALKAIGLPSLVTSSAPKKPAAPGGTAVSTAPGLTTIRAPQAGGPAATKLPAPASGAAPASRPELPSATGTSPVPRSTPLPTAGGEPANTNGASTGSALTSLPQGTARQQLPAERNRIFDLYYVQVDARGSAKIKSVSRPIAFIDSPLTDTIRTLLADSPQSGSPESLISLIPAGTKLIDATVKDGTAYLDFNDRLRFNSFGADGYRAELQQLVFTATQFPTVQRVQVLINGKVHRYLGPEGMAIDKPLSRDSFVIPPGESG